MCDANCSGNVVMLPGEAILESSLAEAQIHLAQYSDVLNGVGDSEKGFKCGSGIKEFRKLFFPEKYVKT